MGQHGNRNSTRVRLVMLSAAAALVTCTLPAGAQTAAGHASSGHISAARPTSPGRSISGRSFGAPMRGGQLRGGQRIGAVHPNAFGASSAPPPSFELPKYVTPHWEIGPHVRIQPNPVQGNVLNNPVRRHRGRFGVGFVGLPYYVDPMAFVDADTTDSEDDTQQQAQQPEPNAPAGPEYGPQAPYAEGPPAPYPAPYGDQGYPPPRAPYNPEGYPPTPQNSAAQNAPAPSDGLDHPAVTLVFNDGRPPEKVNSYVLTGSSVFIAEHGHQRVIPITDLDLPATVQQSREAGVDFELPGTSR